MPRNHRPTYRSANDWPPWTDAYRWEPTDAGPSEPIGEEDRRWAAENPIRLDSHTDDPTPDDVLERSAREAEFQDGYENGFGHF